MSSLNKSVVTRFNQDIIAGKNIALFDSFFDPDFRNHTVRSGYPSGADGVLKFLSENLWIGFTDIRVDILDQFEERDVVTTRKTITGRHSGTFLGQPASGKTISMLLIDIVRLRNGKYLDHWGVFDTGSVIQQIQS